MLMNVLFETNLLSYCFYHLPMCTLVSCQ